MHCGTNIQRRRCVDFGWASGKEICPLIGQTASLALRLQPVSESSSEPIALDKKSAGTRWGRRHLQGSNFTQALAGRKAVLLFRPVCLRRSLSLSFQKRLEIAIHPEKHESKQKQPGENTGKLVTAISLQQDSTLAAIL